MMRSGVNTLKDQRKSNGWVVRTMGGRALVALSLLLILFLGSGGVGEARVQVVSGLTDRYTVAPDGVYEGAIELENTGDRSAKVMIYQSDYLFAAAGGTEYDPPGTTPRSNAEWLELGPDSVVVPPNDTLSIPYKLKVPDDARLQGTYWSVVMIEPVDASPKEDGSGSDSKEEAKMEFGIAQRLRYAVQVITDVGETGDPHVVPENPKLVLREDGTHTFQVDLQNDGTRWVVPKVWLEVYTDEGVLVDRFIGQRLRIYPNTSVRESIPVGKLNAGRYQALLVADGGGEHVFGARYSFTVKPQ